MFGKIVSLALVALLTVPLARAGDSSANGPRFNISFPASVHGQPITGRLFLLISHTNEPEVRLQSTWFNSPEMLGTDVTRLGPEQTAVVDATAPGTPIKTLNDVPAGDYYVQAVLNIYTEFHRADGHVLWLHMDQGEGQQFNRSPGNLYSKVQKIHLEAGAHYNLVLSEVIPPLPAPVDTEWVKHVRLQSPLLTRFWGRPMYVDAIILLPRGYSTNPDRRYPTIYYQPEHFRSFPPFEFTTIETTETPAQRAGREVAGFETGFAFQQAWRSDHFPRMIAVSVLTPTPFSDWSSGLDSANNGPYGRVIVDELIPYIDAHFRTIPQPYARVLTGKHSGGRAALALQVLHADHFGGVWAMHPWAFDFEHYFSLNIYTAENAFRVEADELPDWGRNIATWLAIERPVTRSTTGLPLASFRQLSQHDVALASMAAGDPLGADDSILGPVGENGFPKPLWDRNTGKIDHDVAAYWREHGDLVYYLRQHWTEVGPLLQGKLHLYVGDMDEFYRNYGVHALEDFLKSTESPHCTGEFHYGVLNGGHQPMTNTELVRSMAQHIAAHAPPNSDRAWLQD